MKSAKKSDGDEERVGLIAARELEGEYQELERQSIARSRTCPSAMQQAAVAAMIVLLIIDIFVHTLSAYRWQYQRPSPYLIGNGTTHELPTAVAAMRYVRYNNTGLYTFNRTTSRMTRKQDAPIDYCGPPSFKLDETWESLLRHPLAVLLESEIHPYHRLNEKDRWYEYDAKFHFEPEVYHVLHCLNAVRKEVNRVIYPDSIDQATLDAEKLDKQEITENWHRLHIEHCMDRIRQDIMCHADMTPSTFYGIDDMPVAMFLGKPSERICRDWNAVKTWTEGREELGKLEVEKEKAEGIVRIRPVALEDPDFD